MQIATKLPKVGTTIFTVMSQLAAEHGAVNLGQGFPDFPVPDRLVDALERAMRAGHNQYSMMTGIPALRQAIAAKTERCYGWRPHVDAEITVTSGASEAIFDAIHAVVRAGEEVIVLDPCYDCYEPAIDLAGAKAVHVALDPETFAPDWSAVRAAITPNTRMLMINSPHNPSGAMLSEADMRELVAILDGSDIVLLSDEVYEHIVFDGATHVSCAAHPELAQRSFVVSSFGKTYHITGWKVGYILAPRELMAEFRKVHQFNVFTVNTPVQLALADYMADASRHLALAAFYQGKRDFFREAMAGSRFALLPSGGTYFQLARYGAISDLGDAAFCEHLTRNVGVAAIPVSAFFADGRDERVIRFCFAKNESTLAAACERLCTL